MIKYGDFELKNVATGQTANIPADAIYKFSIDDKITPNYNESTGYGKFDPIVVYKNTTRTVAVNLSLKGGIDYTYLIKDFAVITLPKYFTPESYSSTSNTGSISASSVISAAPLYNLKLAGYFEEFGVIKDLNVKPSFDSKDIMFIQDDFKKSGTTADLNRRYGFTKLDISFSFIVLHKQTPNADDWSSLKNWPFSEG